MNIINALPGIGWLSRHRLAARVITDVVAWAIAVPVAVVLRLDLQAPDDPVMVGVMTLILIGFQLLLGHLFHLYDGRYSFGAFEEARVLAGTVTAVVLLASAVNVVFLGGSVPRLIPVIAAWVALVAMFGVRYAYRMYIERKKRPGPNAAEPVIVFGAGEGGRQGGRLWHPTSVQRPVSHL